MTERSKITLASESGLTIRSTTDISDAIQACIGKADLLLTESDLGPDFFVLHTGLAGELFQKCINYRVRLAIVIPNPPAYGERFAELANEHQSHNTVRFFSSIEDAKTWLKAESPNS